MLLSEPLRIQTQENLSGLSKETDASRRDSSAIPPWLVDTEKCYPFSRLRPEYCHLCVDVCPYIQKENGDSGLRDIFRAFVAERKKAGFNAAKVGAGESDPSLAGTVRKIDSR